MAFPRFDELPVEMKEQIWQLSLPPKPHAHFARLDRRTISTPRETNSVIAMRGAFKHFVKLIRSRAPDGTSGIEDVTSLLQTCAHSRAVALRYSEFSPPVRKTLLWLDRKVPWPSSSSPSSSAIVTTAKKGEERNTPHTPPRDPLPELFINSRTDLVILHKGWGIQAEDLSVPINLYRIESPQQVRFMAVPWTTESTDNNGMEPSLTSLECCQPRGLVKCLRDLLVPYKRLDVLYLLVDPDMLSAASQQPWTETEDWSLFGDDEASLATYLAAYEEGQIHPPSFWCGWREFYEVPAEQVARLGGLETSIKSLEIMRVQRSRKQDAGKSGATATDEPMRFRLMTWRDV